VRFGWLLACCSVHLRVPVDHRLLLAHAKSSRGYPGLPSRAGSRGAFLIACAVNSFG
jgi:hypothetical protein